MIRLKQHIPAGETSAVPDDTITLDFDSRNRRRILLRTDSGSDILLDLAQAVQLREGDLLAAEDGRVVKVKVAPEPVTDIECRSAVELVRLAWHLGNRHLPTQILSSSLRVRQDHVIEALAIGLGAHIQQKIAPFDPEGGAYEHSGKHGRTHPHTHE